MAIERPKVSIIMLCHNQAAYVEECLQSIWSQTYPSIELIIIDDASEDASPDIIRELIKAKSAEFIPLQVNEGNCKAFNKGLQRASGKYIIDLAADDLLLPGKLEKQVAFFESLDESYGVIYSNAHLVDEKNHSLGTHVERIKKIGRVDSMPSGLVFQEVLRNYFIAAPTQMIRKQVFDELGGYDESLAYEDFDFWVRSSRNWKYAYQDEILMTIRKLPTSMSSVMYTRDDPKVKSTLRVCTKALSLLKEKEDEQALIERVKYEFRMAVKYKNKTMKKEWYKLLERLGANSFFYQLLLFTR